MKRLLVAALLALLPLVALADQFREVHLSEDRTRLVITKSDGHQFEAPRYAEQVEFEEPRISPDGNHVGWLAVYPNCCTSYPIPLGVVVLDRERRLHSFGTELAVFAWCFVPNSTSVAYRQAVLHGSDHRHFERRNIPDGRLLNVYDSPHGEIKDIRGRKNLPSWVRACQVGPSCCLRISASNGAPPSACACVRAVGAER